MSDQSFKNNDLEIKYKRYLQKALSHPEKSFENFVNGLRNNTPELLKLKLIVP